MHITKDSRECKEGSIYFCFIGEQVDGHDYIESALKNGATKIIGTKDIKLDQYKQVDDIDLEFTKYAKECYDYENVKMKFVGITGTDGKTSTAILIDKILNKLSSSSYLGTSGLYINRQLIKNDGMTTPFADELYHDINIANNSSEYFVMEVSSHALKQKRVVGLQYDVGIFTNFTSDHLDFHKTIDDYFKSKTLIFDQIKSDGNILVNSDMNNFTKLPKDKRIITFGKQGKYQISNVNLAINRTTFDLKYKNTSYQINSPLLAEFNVYNLTAAIITCHLLGYTLDEIINSISDLSVEGRLMYINNVKVADCILDFAHTADSIEKIMSFVNEYKDSESKVCVITGSAGGRDKSKRPLMGEKASQYSDLLLLTTDDPRFESVETISNEIKSGVKNKNCKVKLIEDRTEAIKYAFKTMSKNDIIVCLGKSGQNVMYVEDKKIKYDEIEVVNQIIKEHNG